MPKLILVPCKCKGWHFKGNKKFCMTAARMSEWAKSRDKCKCTHLRMTHHFEGPCRVCMVGWKICNQFQDNK